MQYVLSMNELHALADLSHEDGTTAFGQQEVVVYYPLEQFTTFDPSNTKIAVV